MNLECKTVIEDFSLHQKPDLTYQEKAECKQHLVECAACQSKYEEMLHTVAILEILPEPVPPPDLVERIQTYLRQTRRRSLLDFLANPIARILVALKLGPHPAFVNYTAMLFYLMLTVFLAKLTFFRSIDPVPVVAPMKPIQPQIRIVRLGDVKRRIIIEQPPPKAVPIQSETSNLQ